ncbi:hypothetical protein JQK19_19495 [Chromobacterium violaceum]|uniref:hypothetical protein n=1 Tax=Chromobacterium violaceum TaxID=536 RepID=UPI001BE962DA|nr:hypothetical protein [Chromobacterium violaceum]MBT2869415.1 hypothetical protein [Chromobacterium violaceum]
MKKSRKWMYVCGAGGMLLTVGCQAGPLSLSSARMMSYGNGSVMLSPHLLQSRSDVSEAERLTQLRALVHDVSIHCNDPSCPICNPRNQNRQPASF